MEVLDGCFVMSGHTEEKVGHVPLLPYRAYRIHTRKWGDSYEARGGRVGIVIFNFKVHLTIFLQRFIFSMFLSSEDCKFVTIHSYTL